MGITVHSGFAGSLDKALTLIVSPKLPGFTIGDLTTQRPLIVRP